jgi:hypothetical protein
MSNNFRNADLLQKLARHPLKASLARALDTSELFAGDVEHIKLDRRLSAEGRDDARRSKLRAALRDNRDARAPLKEMQAKLEAKRKAVSMPKFDPADVLGFLRRQELRATLRTVDAGQRRMKGDDTNDTVKIPCWDESSSHASSQPRKAGGEHRAIPRRFGEAENNARASAAGRDGEPWWDVRHGYVEEAQVNQDRRRRGV